MHKKHSKCKVESAWVVYMVQCGDGSLYTGVTTDVDRRIRQHNGELTGGARYTRVRRPVALEYAEPCANRAEACRREYQIKQLSRQDKLALSRLTTETVNQ